MPPAAPKRKRASPATPPPLPVVEEFSTYFNHPSADILLRSVDGVLFATKRSYLVAASSVLEDMLEIARPPQQAGEIKEGQAAPGGLPVVKMAEKGKDLELFLRWIHRETFGDVFASIDENEDDLDNLDAIIPLFEMAHKFDVSTIIPTLCVVLKEGKILEREPLTTLALAVVYDIPKLARSSLQAWFNEYEAPTRLKPDSTNRDPRNTQILDHWKPQNVYNILPSIFLRLPVGFFYHFGRLESALLHDTKFNYKGGMKTFMQAMERSFDLNLDE